MKIKIFSNRNIILFMAAVFVLWLLFFDRNSLVGLQGVDSQIEELEIERDFLRNRIKEDSIVIQGIKDSVYLETYARESFFMKYSDEKMYIYQ